jgi:cyclic pyranopterin phosphate synthase
MTEAFCAGCNRLRLTADGRLMVCLFGQSGVSLRDALRDGAGDDTIRSLVTTSVKGKKAAHGGMDVVAAQTERPMILIGG